MTFSDPDVAAFANENFVAAWHNRGPGFHDSEFSTEKSIFQHSMEAYPTKNICTFFLSPDGGVFFYVAGYYSPHLFLRVLQTVATLRAAQFDEAMRPRPDAVGEVRRAHATIAGSMREYAANFLGGNWSPEAWKKWAEEYPTHTYRGVKHSHSRWCARSLGAASDYLARLHERWGQAPELLPDLDSVRYTYLWGNPFSEEPADGQRIETPAASSPRRAPCAMAPQPKPDSKPDAKKPEPVHVLNVKFPTGRSFTGVALSIPRSARPE